MKKLRPSAIALAALALAAFQPAAAQTATAPVKVTGGDIVGSDDGTLKTYFGIPFAAPPVGELRWRAPQPVVPWQGTRDATHLSAACAQTANWLPDPKSEDCLYLNVWAPEGAQKLPVMVWIHGGGYYGGSGVQPNFNGAGLAKHGVIVVTLNYRLGIFGFFADPELSAESPDKASGNQGIEDQLAALHWVHDNIAALGGDPSRVTIMGESSGGESVAILTASPLAKGLFQRAIAESGNDAMPIDPSEDNQFDRKTAEKEGADFAKAVGAKNLADLRAMSVEALQKQPWSPRTIVDGHLIVEDLTTTYRLHHQNDVPLLVGWNAEEGKDLAPEILETNDFNAGDFRELVTKLLGHAPSPTLLAAYPATTDSQAKASINQMTNDWWGWRLWHWAGLQARYGHSKSYVYFFAHPPAPPATPCGYGCGVGHGAEIRYALDHLDWNPQDPRDWTAYDHKLAWQMGETWATFAKTGNPNAQGLPKWSAFDGANTNVHRIGNDEDLKAHGTLPDFSLFASSPEIKPAS